MFTRDIAVEGHDTLNVHYVHARSKIEGAIPLLFVHGCTPVISVSQSAPNKRLIHLHSRARELLGSNQDPFSTLEPDRRRVASFPRRSTESAWLCVLRSAEEAGLRSEEDGGALS